MYYKAPDISLVIIQGIKYLTIYDTVPDISPFMTTLQISPYSLSGIRLENNEVSGPSGLPPPTQAISFFVG